MQVALGRAGLRAEVDERAESVSKKIRDGEMLKVPFMLVVGDKEIESRGVTLRTRGQKETEPLGLEALVDRLSAICRPPDTP